MRRFKPSPAENIKARLERHDLVPLNEDAKFIVACLQRIPSHAHEWAIERYISHWLSAMKPVEVDHLRQNTGRRAANQWLVGVLKKKNLPLPCSQEIKQVRV